MTDWCNKTPLEWQAYVNKEVKISTDEKHEYQGWVATIDPVSANIVLVNFLQDQKILVQVVMGHAVQQVEELKEADYATGERLMQLFSPGETTAYSKEDLDTKKLSLRTWLEQNHIPVTEQGEAQGTLCVAGVLTIDPPYGPDNCSSANEIILSRVQGLIQGFMTGQ
ncbi:hypothetical protein FKM82_010548 [Ascaphus truei]|uniref:gem-associated protein 6 n=1 Tax=Ascaphus truei TaxID=8439 RepID=UPI003F5A9AC8